MADMKREMQFCYVVVSLLKRRLDVLKIRLEKGGGKERKKKYIVCRKAIDITIAVMMAKRSHLFPFRTQKLSSFTPKVLAGYCWEDR